MAHQPPTVRHATLAPETGRSGALPASGPNAFVIAHVRANERTNAEAGKLAAARLFFEPTTGTGGSDAAKRGRTTHRWQRGKRVRSQRPRRQQAALRLPIHANPRRSSANGTSDSGQSRHCPCRTRHKPECRSRALAQQLFACAGGCPGLSHAMNTRCRFGAGFDATRGRDGRRQPGIASTIVPGHGTICTPRRATGLDSGSHRRLRTMMRTSASASRA